MDRYDSEEEKKRYAIRRVSSEAAFPVIMSGDMNGIGLELYKRNASRSRAATCVMRMRWGSTRQSQGI